MPLSLSHTLHLTTCLLFACTITSPAETQEPTPHQNQTSPIPDHPNPDQTNQTEIKQPEPTNNEYSHNPSTPPSSNNPVEIPPDLLENTELLNSRGIDEAAAPSIRKLFTFCCSDLGALPYNDLRRNPLPSPAQDRTLLAMHLGALIADGFLVVTSNRLRDIELVGTAILEHAEILGTGRHIKAHAKSLLEFAAAGQHEKLNEELVITQIDIEKEMIDLRDPEMAFLISLGGWARSFEIGCVTVMRDFKEDHVRHLARTDLVAFFIDRIEHMPGRIRERQPLIDIQETLAEIAIAFDIPEDESFTPTNLANMRRLAAQLMKIISSAN